MKTRENSSIFDYDISNSQVGFDLNGQKMALNKPTPNKFEEKKEQFEALLKQTMMQMRIVQLKALNKKEKIKQLEDQKSPSKIHLVSIDGPEDGNDNIVTEEMDLKVEGKKEKISNNQEEPKKPRYFPPRKIVNPFDER